MRYGSFATAFPSESMRQISIHVSCLLSGQDATAELGGELLLWPAMARLTSEAGMPSAMLRRAGLVRCESASCASVSQPRPQGPEAWQLPTYSAGRLRSRKRPAMRLRNRPRRETPGAHISESLQDHENPALVRILEYLRRTRPVPDHLNAAPRPDTTTTDIHTASERAKHRTRSPSALGESSARQISYIK